MILGVKKMIFIVGVLVVAVSIVYMNVSAARTLTELEENPHVVPVSANELSELLQDPEFNEKYALIDVRTPVEYNMGTIAESINIPHYNILNDVSLLDPYKGKQMILYCHSGVRAGKVTRLLTSLAYSNLSHLEGDISGWKRNNKPVEKPE
jgi:rhodanese-related sulfurtransferase